MGSYSGPEINDSGTVLALDAANSKSYTGSGSTWTDMVFGNNATLINSPTFSTTKGGCLVFNKANSQYATIASRPLWAVGSNAAVEMWTYLTGSITTNHRFWCVNNNSTNLDAYIDSATGKVGFHGSQFITSSIYPYNAWTQLVVVYTAGVPTVYFNAVSQSLIGTLSGYNISGTGTLFIGQYSGGGNYYINGNIASFRIYNRALSATEVLQNYNAMKWRFV